MKNKEVIDHEYKLFPSNQGKIKESFIIEEDE